MYKMILSDLDETLLVNHHVPKFNQDVVHKVCEKGVKFVPATGRAYNMIGDILKEIGTYQKENEYSICFNGGLIVENKNDRILHFKGLTFEQTKTFFEIGLQYEVCILIFTLDCCYIFRADPNEVQRKIDQKAHFEVIDVDCMDFLKNEKIAKILFERRDMDYLFDIEKNIDPHLKKDISISYSSYRYLEINPLGIDKGYGLRWLANYLGYRSEEVIAIGDNYNDVEMIKEAGLGACVSSAREDIQTLANYVAKCDYDEGAVREVIEKFVLEEKKDV